MESISGDDHLGFGVDEEIKKIILDEKALYSDKIIKINRYDMSQERNILVTNKAVYNFKKKSKIFLFSILFRLKKKN